MGRQIDLIALNTSADNKKYRFTLSNATYGTYRLQYAPDGYDPEQFAFVRDMKTFGVFRKFTQNEMKFVKDGRDYVQLCYESFGVNAEVTLQVEELHPDTLLYITRFTGTLDFSTYKVDETSVAIQVIDSRFIEKIFNRESVKVNLLGGTSIDGNYIGLAIPKNIIIPEVSIIQSANYSGVVDQYVDDHIAPITMINSEYTEAFTPEQGNNYLTNSFFRNALEAYNLNFSGHVKVKISFTSDELSHYAFYFNIVRYGSTGVYKDEVILFEISGQGDPGVISVDELIDSQLSVVEGDYLTFTVTATTSLGLNVYYDYISIDFTTNNIIAALPSKTINGLPYHEAFERIVAHYTGQTNKVYSDFFGRTDIGYPVDGVIGGICTGLMIRNITGVNNTLATSLKDLFASLSIYNIGIGEENGILRIEPMEYWFPNNIVLDISDRLATETIRKEVIPDLLANSLKIGYSSFEYDRTGGIYEYNTLSEFTTILKLENSFSLVSPYRADMTGMIKILQETDNTKDTKEDGGIFMLDCIRDAVNVNDFLVRTNQGFDYAMGGTDTDQNFNLLLTPARTLRRWGRYIRAMLDRWQLSYIRWQTSEKATTLRTKVSGELEVAEKADIKVGDLNAPLWHPEKYIVSAYLTLDEMELLVADPSGIIKLAEDKYGWILDAKIKNDSKEMELSLLRVNTDYVTPVVVVPIFPVNYGLLYNWYAVTDVRGICADGWEVPTQTNWIALIEYLEGVESEPGSGLFADVGGYLKENELTYWSTPNTGATNQVNLNIRGAASRDTNDGSFGGLKFGTFLFGLTCRVSIHYHTGALVVDYGATYGNDAYSLRLIKTTTSLTHGQTGTYTGNDGKVYRTICIGTQEWLGDNLAETKYRNGEWIHGYDGGVYTPISNEDWAALTTSALCAYNDDINNI